MNTRQLFTAAALTLTLVACEQTPDVIFDSPSSSSSAAASLEARSSASAATSTAAATSTPGSVLIRVPFASQAPLGDWGDPYQEACEESSLILVKAFLNGESMSPQIMDKSIVDLVAYETQSGYGHDVNIAQLAKIAKAHYGLNAQAKYEFTKADIEAELAAGNPVIVPLAGRDIGNPYYSGEGPWYHMLVIIGYDRDSFITNDVGTKRGEHYAYDKDVLFNAIHDWTGVKEEIRSGAKAMLVVTK